MSYDFVENIMAVYMDLKELYTIQNNLLRFFLSIFEPSFFLSYKIFSILSSLSNNVLQLNNTQIPNSTHFLKYSSLNSQAQVVGCYCVNWWRVSSTQSITSSKKSSWNFKKFIVWLWTRIKTKYIYTKIR